MKVLVMTHFSKAALEVSLGMLSSMSKLGNSDVIIASLNAGHEVEQYLASQENYKYILADENDSYGMVLNAVIGEFLDKDESLAIISEGTALFPDALDVAEGCILEKGVGAIVFDKCYADDGGYAELMNSHEKKNRLSALVGWGEEGLVLSGKMISENGTFDESYFNPRNVLVDYLFSAGQKGYKFYKSSDCVEYVFYKIPNDRNVYLKEMTIRDKWGMNYFTYKPNEILMNIIPLDYIGEINVLEVGCDCGGNGAGVKEKYPDCHLYGLELNPNSAKIAATIYDEVIVGNAEEMDLPFDDVSFDIVIFGDVLEHLRDPLGMLKKCHARMNKGGVVITSIPNLMHYTVMRQLINGHFQYESDGLLDRTHIHFFTAYEILNMFGEAGFEVEEALSTVVGSPSEEEDKMIETLLTLSTNTNRVMYETFQYNVRARK